VDELGLDLGELRGGEGPGEQLAEEGIPSYVFSRRGGSWKKAMDGG